MKILANCADLDFTNGNLILTFSREQRWNVENIRINS
jgi:hypothetical protein